MFVCVRVVDFRFHNFMNGISFDVYWVCIGVSRYHWPTEWVSFECVFKCITADTLTLLCILDRAYGVGIPSFIHSVEIYVTYTHYTHTHGRTHTLIFIQSVFVLLDIFDRTGIVYKHIGKMCDTTPCVCVWVCVNEEKQWETFIQYIPIFTDVHL